MALRVFITFLMLMAGISASAQVITRSELRNTNTLIDARMAARTNTVTTNLTVLATNIANAAAAAANTNLNVLYVSKSGSDTTGVRNRADKPFLSIGAAKTNAAAGDVIRVSPGIYDETDLIKVGVNLHFDAGSIVRYTGPSDRAVFDDWTGKTTNYISGSGEFFNYTTSTNATAYLSAILVTNQLTTFNISGVRLGGKFTNTEFAAVINMMGGWGDTSRKGGSVVSFDRIELTGSSFFSTGSGGYAVLAMRGYVYLRLFARDIYSTSRGIVWTPMQNPYTFGALWARCEFMNCALENVIMDVDAVNVSGNDGDSATIWLDSEEVRSGFRGNVIVTNAGKLYLSAQKIYTEDPEFSRMTNIIVARDAVVWIDANKIQSGTGAAFDLSGGTTLVTVQSFVTDGSGQASPFPLAYIRGGTNTLQWGTAATKTQHGFVVSGGISTMAFSSLSVPSTNTAIAVSGGTVTLQGGRVTGGTNLFQSGGTLNVNGTTFDPTASGGTLTFGHQSFNYITEGSLPGSGDIVAADASGNHFRTNITGEVTTAQLATKITAIGGGGTNNAMTNASLFEKVSLNSPGSALSVDLVGRQPDTNSTSTGTSASSTGRVSFTGGRGGTTTNPATATGGPAGTVLITGGKGGDAPLATTNATGGTGAQVSLTGGAGGMGSDVVGTATNATTGGSGGPVVVSGGAGASPATPATNTVGGTGGNAQVVSGNGGSPTAGLTRKGATAGTVNITGGNGGAGVATNGGGGGNINITGGTAGNATTSGYPGLAGRVVVSGGNGGAGDTNSNGGSVYLVGGVAGGGSSVAGDVILGSTAAPFIQGRVRLAALTTNLIVVVDSSGNLVNATGTADSTTFLRSDGILIAPAGGEVTTAQLNTASNLLAALLVANDTFTSNAIWAAKIDKLNGTGTNLSAQTFIGSTNAPFVVRDTNSNALLWVSTNKYLMIGAGGEIAFVDAIGGSVKRVVSLNNAHLYLGNPTNVMAVALSAYDAPDPDSFPGSLTFTGHKFYPDVDGVQLGPFGDLLLRGKTGLARNPLIIVNTNNTSTNFLVDTNGAAYLPLLPTNAFMRIGASGLVTTGSIGSGLSLSAAGELSATGGGGSVTTNADQFAANPTLTIKSAAKVTNLTHHGTLTLSTEGTVSTLAFPHNIKFGYDVVSKEVTLSDVNNGFIPFTYNTNRSMTLVATGVTINAALEIKSNTTFSAGVTLSALTASRPLILNGSGNMTNATGTPDGTKFLRDDGTLAVPSGSGTPGGNSGAVQFNEGGASAGTNDLNWDRTNHIFAIRNIDATPGTGLGNSYLYLGGSLGIPYFSLFSDTNVFRIQRDFGTTGFGFTYHYPNRYINIGSTANDTGTNFGNWYFPSNVTFGGTATFNNGTGTGATVSSNAPVLNNATLLGTTTLDVLSIGTLVITSNTTEFAASGITYKAIDPDIGPKWVNTNAPNGNIVADYQHLHKQTNNSLSVTWHGDYAGGTDRYVTNIFSATIGSVPTVWSVDGATTAVTFTQTLTNGYFQQVLTEVHFFGGTNYAKAVILNGKL